MASFEVAIRTLLPREGGLSDDKSDPGGLTNFGIALNRHPELTADDIRNMTPERAIEIYHKSYWTPFLDEVRDQDVANYLFDIRVNQGPSTELSILQSALGYSGGYSGTSNLAALTNSRVPAKLLAELKARRIVAYHRFLLSHPDEEKNALGLFRRAVFFNG